MLPINLLPNYIFDKNKKINAGIVCGVVIALVIGFFVVWIGNVSKSLEDAKAELADATEKKSTYDARVNDIKKVNDAIAVTKSKQTFIADAQKYNDSWPETFSLIRDLTSDYVLLKNMAFTGTDHKTIKLSAFAGNEEVIAKWWVALRDRADIFDNVTMQYPNRPYAPGKSATATGGMPGSGGGGMKGAMMSGMAMPGSAGMGMPGSAGMGMPGMPGSGGGAAGGDSVGPTEIEGRPGINFIATLTLKTALDKGAPAPVWPSGPAAAAPAGGGAPSLGGGKPGAGGPGGRGD